MQVASMEKSAEFGSGSLINKLQQSRQEDSGTALKHESQLKLTNQLSEKKEVNSLL